MLIFRRPRCPLHSARFLQVRTLRSFPRKIPSYMRTWNPILHPSAPAHDPSTSSPGEQSPDNVDPTTSMAQKSVDRVPHEWYGIRREDAKPPHIVRKFQYLLQRVASEPVSVDSIRAPLWKAYVRAKQADPELTGRMSEADWDTLHKSQIMGTSDADKQNPSVDMLVRDMKAAGWPRVGQTRAKYLEDMFLQGRRGEALRRWEEDHVRFRHGKQELKAEHLDIGARLFALARKPTRAREIMEELFSLHPEANPAVMMTVFRAHTSSEHEQDHTYARDMYTTMKERMTTNSTLQDYDSWFVGFLEARDLSSANRTFKDMIQDGHLTTTGSAGDVSEVLQRHYMLYKLADNMQSTTDIAMNALAVLPESYHGYLYGAWMKTAVVQQSPEAAAQILEMMIQRGCTPETVHLNLLLRALISNKKTSNVTKFENIGWRMVDASSDTSTETSEPQSKSVLSQIVNRQKSPKLLEQLRDGNQDLPAADNVTFALLIQHHNKRQEWEHVDYLSRRLRNSGLKPNATILNVLVEIKCRQGAYAEAWSIYRALTTPSSDNPRPVFPNGATIRHLWMNLRLALGHVSTRYDSNLPSPRDLMMETNEWWQKCRSRPDAARFRMGLAGPNGGAIAPLMLHCFGYMNDLAGAIVTLNFLRHKFEIFPSEREANYLHRSIIWMQGEDAFEVSPDWKQKSLARIREIYAQLTDNRLKRMEKRGVKTQDMSPNQMGEFTLNLLSELLRAVLLMGNAPETVESMIEDAKRDMGLRELQTGDMDAFDMVLFGTVPKDSMIGDTPS